MNIVALFLKSPVLGTVKTRLAKSLGDEAALTAYMDLVEFLLKRITQSRIHVHHTPHDSAPMKQWLGDNYAYSAQEGPGLGERLIHAMELEFAAGAEKLIFLGGDCPYLDQERMDESFAALDDHDVVIGPATDGGYYLIGMKEERSELFTDVVWGTESVFEKSMQICSEKGLSCFVLPEESDVDELTEWKAARHYMDQI